MNSTELIDKAEKRYKELKRKQFDRNSFLNGYFEGYGGSVIQQQVSVEPEVKVQIAEAIDEHIEIAKNDCMNENTAYMRGYIRGCNKIKEIIASKISA